MVKKILVYQNDRMDLINFVELIKGFFNVDMVVIDVILVRISKTIKNCLILYRLGETGQVAGEFIFAPCFLL